MQLKCPSCGKNDCITAETHSAQWCPIEKIWMESDEICGPYICQHCMYESKYVDDFIIKTGQ